MLKKLLKKLQNLCSENNAGHPSPAFIIDLSSNVVKIVREDNGKCVFVGFKYFELENSVILVQGGSGGVFYFRKIEKLGDNKYKVEQLAI